MTAAAGVVQVVWVTGTGHRAQHAVESLFWNDKLTHAQVSLAKISQIILLCYHAAMSTDQSNLTGCGINPLRGSGIGLVLFDASTG